MHMKQKIALIMFIMVLHVSHYSGEF